MQRQIALTPSRFAASYSSSEKRSFCLSFMVNLAAPRIQFVDYTQYRLVSCRYDDVCLHESSYGYLQFTCSVPRF